MLQIRREQVKTLQQASILEFEIKMLAHIKKFFPAHFEELGEDNCRELTRYGIEQGAKYGFVSERNVCKFIDLMLSFGVEFDKDPKQTWASRMLQDDAWITANAKMEALFKEGVKRLQK